MRAIRYSFPVIVTLALLGTPGSFAAEARRVAGVAGQVTGEKSPLPAVIVYAYQLADLSLRKATTDPQGRFLFKELPAGLYKIVAHKPGFIPVVSMLTRTTAQAYQTVEMQLLERQVGEPEGDDFWSIRARIPSDVLREIEREEAGEVQLASFFSMSPGGTALDLPGFQTEMQALTGVDAGNGQMSGGGLGIKGRVGEVQVGLQGRFLMSDGAVGSVAGSGPMSGQMSALSLNLERGESSRLSVSSVNNRMSAGPRNQNSDGPVDYEHYQVNFSQEVGENGRSDFAAVYTEESNFHRHGTVDPFPGASRIWQIGGAYTVDLGDRSSLQAGMRYRERQFGLSGSDQPNHMLEQPALSSMDLFSRGGTRVQPAVLVEYGLYSTLSDGSLSLMPQGGIVVQLSDAWQVGASASQRVYEDTRIVPDFLPSLFQQRDLCEQGSESCYELRFTRSVADDNTFSFGAVHRTVADTLRLYFSEDFFDRLESLYLVRGDEIPELRMSATRRLSPKVVSTLEASLASGGGGIFFAPGGRTYENQVSYLVTSLDTQFQKTSTGIFVAFHRLNQQLLPAGAAAPSTPEIEYERLRLMVSQDLSFLLDLAADWAVQLNMELSRGNDSASAAHDLRHRFLGGIAVKF